MNWIWSFRYTNRSWYCLKCSLVVCFANQTSAACWNRSVKQKSWLKSWQSPVKTQRVNWMMGLVSKNNFNWGVILDEGLVVDQAEGSGRAWECRGRFAKKKSRCHDQHIKQQTYRIFSEILVGLIRHGVTFNSCTSCFCRWNICLVWLIRRSSDSMQYQYLPYTWKRTITACEQYGS